MRRFWFAAALVAAAVLAPQRPLQAQTAEQQAVRAVIDRMFDGMRRGDSAAVRSVLYSQARLTSVGLRQGQLTVRAESMDAFVATVGTPHPDVWDERISNVDVRIDGPLAVAWMDYSFFLGQRFSHCGVNVFHLVKDGEAWKVMSITDTRRREGCRDAPPAGGL